MNRFRDFDWLATVIYPLAVILMEAFWVYPWLIWLGSLPFFNQSRSPLSLASVIIVLVAATAAIRLFQRQKWPVGLVRPAIVFSGLVVILLVLGIEYGAGYGFLSGQWFAYAGDAFGNILTRPDTLVAALPALLYLWWRGTGLGQSTSFFQSIYRSFLLGMVALIVLIIIWQFSPSEDDFTGFGTVVGLHILVFFFFGLLAMAISHLYLMRSTMPREEAGLTSVWRWLPAMLIVVGGMVAAVFGIGGIFTEGLFTSVRHGIGVTWDFMVMIFNYVLMPFNIVFEGIFRVMRWIVELLRGKAFQPIEGSGNTSAQEPFPETTPWEPPSEFYTVIKWLVIMVIIAVVVFILAKAVSRYRARQAEDRIEEIHESLFSWRGLRGDLREFFSSLGKKFQRKPSASPPVFDSGDDTRRMDIREIYRRMLWESARSGIIRRRHETPTEYSNRMGHMVPDSRESLNGLTDIYIGVRYGETCPPGEKVDKANGLWQALRGLLRGLRGE